MTDKEIIKECVKLVADSYEVERKDIEKFGAKYLSNYCDVKRLEDFIDGYQENIRITEEEFEKSVDAIQENMLTTRDFAIAAVLTVQLVLQGKMR